MGNQNAPVDPKLLLEQSGWLLTLARNLVRDPFGAEDVAQETLLAALSSPPPDAGDARRLRAWLGRVAFNLAHLSRRRSVRRRTREERVARAEEMSSAADSVLHTSRLRLVLEAVMQLDEPYRSTVLLRYFGAKSIADIARESETTGNAVRKRLWRARERLRQILDAQHNGERVAWFQALAPLALVAPESGTSAAAPVSGSTTVGLGAKAVLGVAAAATAASLALLARPAEPTGVPVAPAPLVRSAALEPTVPHWERAPLGPELPAPRTGPRAGRSERPADAPPSADAPERRERAHGETARAEDAEVAAHRVRGAVLDPAGLAVAGAAVVFASAPAEPLATSAADGSFELAPAARTGELRATAAGLTTLLPARLERTTVDAPRHIVVAPAVDVTGRVADTAGRALSGATLRVVFGPELFAAYPLPFETTAPLAPEASVGGDGRFALAGAPSWEGIYLEAWRAGYHPARVAMPRVATASLAIVLEAALEPVARVEGVVVFPSGAPADEVLVRLGGNEARTDRRGRFALQVLEPVVADTPLYAYWAGFEAATVPRFGASVVGSEEALHRVRIELDGNATVVAGRVLDPLGRPAPGWIVTAVRDASGAGSGALVADGSSGAGTLQGMEGGGGPAGLLDQTSADGSFQLPVLDGGAYHVQAFDPALFTTARAALVPAGTRALELRADAGSLLAAVAGTVVAPDGTPLANARVRVALRVAHGASTWLVTRDDDASAYTDARGAFALQGVPAHGAAFQVAHSALGQEACVAAPAMAVAPRLVVARDAFLRAEIGHRRADRFVLFDDVGRPLTASALGVARAEDAGRLSGGASALVRAPETAHTIALYANGVEVQRAAIALEAGRVVLVRR